MCHLRGIPSRNAVGAVCVPSLSVHYTTDAFRATATRRHSAQVVDSFARRNVGDPIPRDNPEPTIDEAPPVGLRNNDPPSIQSRSGRPENTSAQDIRPIYTLCTPVAKASNHFITARCPASAHRFVPHPIWNARTPTDAINTPASPGSMCTHCFSLSADIR